jgi:hypothetical protein
MELRWHHYWVAVWRRKSMTGGSVPVDPGSRAHGGHRICRVGALVFLLCLLPRAAVAQFDILERAVSKVEGVSLFYLYGALSSGSGALTTSQAPGRSKRTGLQGFGVELSISLGAIPGSRELSDAECQEEKDLYGVLDTVESYTERRTVDGRETTTSVLRTKPKPALCEAPDLASLQLALGYSQLRGFSAADPTIGINGSLAESPAVALYATFLPEGPISP